MFYWKQCSVFSVAFLCCRIYHWPLQTPGTMKKVVQNLRAAETFTFIITLLEGDQQRTDIHTRIVNLSPRYRHTWRILQTTTSVSLWSSRWKSTCRPHMPPNRYSSRCLYSATIVSVLKSTHCLFSVYHVIICVSFFLFLGRPCGCRAGATLSSCQRRQ